MKEKRLRRIIREEIENVIREEELSAEEKEKLDHVYTTMKRGVMNNDVDQVRSGTGTIRIAQQKGKEWAYSREAKELKKFANRAIKFIKGETKEHPDQNPPESYPFRP